MPSHVPVSLKIKDSTTTRTYCQAQGGTKCAVYAKNRAGQALAGAIGKKIWIGYRQGDKGLITSRKRYLEKAGGASRK